jgi:hypothetical protein
MAFLLPGIRRFLEFTRGVLERIREIVPRGISPEVSPGEPVQVVSYTADWVYPSGSPGPFPIEGQIVVPAGTPPDVIIELALDDADSKITRQVTGAQAITVTIF